MILYFHFSRIAYSEGSEIMIVAIQRNDTEKISMAPEPNIETERKKGEKKNKEQNEKKYKFIDEVVPAIHVPKGKRNYVLSM